MFFSPINHQAYMRQEKDNAYLHHGKTLVKDGSGTRFNQGTPNTSRWKLASFLIIASISMS